jgi:hypothetical protein
MDERITEIARLLSVDDIATARQKFDEHEVGRQIERMEAAESGEQFRLLLNGCKQITRFHDILDTLPGQWHRRYTDAIQRRFRLPQNLVFSDFSKFKIILNLGNGSEGGAASDHAG